MFYSELLLMECSEAEPGEGAGEAAAAAQRGGGQKGVWVRVCEYTPPLTLLAGHRVARGAADVNTALLKTSPSSGENRRRKKKRRGKKKI